MTSNFLQLKKKIVLKNKQTNVLTKLQIVQTKYLFIKKNQLLTTVNTTTNEKLYKFKNTHQNAK